jgi:uncharacterized protein (DUF2249 family)
MTAVIGRGGDTGYSRSSEGGPMSTSTATVPTTIDIRQLGACAERKACVLAAFDALNRGESLIVINDHLPNGLRAHLDELRPGLFVWRPLEQGPYTFRIQIECL